MKKEFTIGKHGTEPSIEPQEDFFNLDVEAGLILVINLIISAINTVLCLITDKSEFCSAAIATVIALICFCVYTFLTKHGYDKFGIGIRLSIWR